MGGLPGVYSRGEEVSHWREVELMGRGILTWLEREPPWGGARNRREFGQGGERPSFMTCTWGGLLRDFFFFSFPSQG